MIKKIISILFICIFYVTLCGYTKTNMYKIDASKNAISHNNLGLMKLADRNYLGAIQEFTIAISLNPNTQATSVYYNNLGKAYMQLGYYKQAQKCFENSITQYNLNFEYYQNLVKSFKHQGILGTKIKTYQARGENNPLTMVLLGVMYVESGNRRRGIIKLDEFCMREPSLLITGAVRNYIKELTSY